MSDESNDGILKLAIVIISCLLGALLFGFLVILLLEMRTSYKPSLCSTSLRPRLSLFLLLGAVFALAAMQLQVPNRFLSLLFFSWSVSALIGLWTARYWHRFLKPKTIRADCLSRRPIATKSAKRKIDREAFIGRSFIDHHDVYLNENERCMHLLVSGSTGSGKTTVLKSLFQDAVLKKQPILIIDPKGNNETIQELKTMLFQAGRNSSIFKTFSIMNPDTSARYNPLSRGTAMQIRDRIMGSFVWSEPFYKNQASAFLSDITDVLTALRVPLTIRRLRRVMSDPMAQEELLALIAAVPDKGRAKELIQRLKAALRISKDNLDGLLAQLRDLDNLEFGELFETTGLSPTIDLESIIRNGEIAYFQLNTMAYEEAAKTIGRLVLQDLKALASQIHGGQIELEPKFFPVFVDEFGSFAFEGFIDFLKMARDVKFANHLFFQSLADLDVVSPEFKSQVQQNCLTKLILRTDDPDEVNFWAGVAGTVDSIEASHQVASVLGIKFKTGQGNMRYTKQMRIEHDVFKRLRVGEAVLIQKSPAREDLVSLWNQTSI